MSRNTANAAEPVERFFKFSMLGLVTSGYLAVVGSGYLDLPTVVLTGAALLVWALAIFGVLSLKVSPRMVALATLAYIGFYPIDYAFISGEFLQATVHLVFFLAVVKVLTASINRDYAFVAVIAFLELLAAAVLSGNANFFVFLALFMLFGVAAFTSGEIRRSLRGSRDVARSGLPRLNWRLAGTTIGIVAGILLFTGALFFLLPRTAQAAFRHLVPERFHISGFSNEVVLGQIGELQQRKTAIMHIRIPDFREPVALKWRGASLSRFDGKKWFNPVLPNQILRAKDGMVSLAGDDQRRRIGKRISYEVQLSSLTGDTVFFAGTPEFLWTSLPFVIRAPNESYRLGFGGVEPTRYGAHSFLEDRTKVPPPAPVPSSVLYCCLELPELDPRIAELARRLTHGFTSARASALAIESHLQRNYRYSLELPSKEVPDPLAHFLFERRKGHCEYFASAMAVMLRSIGIPSRIANGFQSGTYNPVSGWYVIRASDAHSWVEAYLPGSGWTTFDPTPPNPNPPAFSLFSRLGFYLDAAETFWQEWVLNYDLNRQLALASRMEVSSRSFGSHWLGTLRNNAARWKDGVLGWFENYGTLAGLILAVSVIFYAASPLAGAWWRTRQRVRKVQNGEVCASDATLLYERMLALMKRRGFNKPGWLTPAEFVQVLPEDTAALAGEFTAAYNDLRFGGRESAALKMLSTLERIEQSCNGS